ncbi:ATP-grasp domain-containing protein [Thermogutta sp.]|uniref:ATP-grasp domain-containing protein n=1 Tax=Thermogutta sp. TaxID=1962930 RepID=UPI00321FE786
MRHACHHNVLVTCGGKWVGHILQLREAMREIPEFQTGRIYVADREAVTPAGAFADGTFQVPPIADSSYPHVLLELCRHHEIRVVIPLIDIDALALAPYRERFAEIGVVAIAPPVHVAELCFDKLRFAEWAKRHGIPVPRVFHPEDLDRAPFPLFAKQVRGFGSIGAGVCHNRDEARRVLADCRMFLEEFISGVEYSVDGYVNRVGQPIVRVVRIREKVVGGEAFRSCTIRNEAVARVADQVLAALAHEGHRGPVNIQIIAGEKTAVIDVNPRLGSAVVLSNQATGGRLFRSLLLESLGQTAQGDPDDYVAGLHLWRFLGDLFYRQGEVKKVCPEPTARRSSPPEIVFQNDGDSDASPGPSQAHSDGLVSRPHWLRQSHREGQSDELSRHRPS